MENVSQQLEEIEVLKSIFNNDWKTDTETGIYSFQFKNDVKLFITLNPDYPSDAPPSYDLLAPNLSSNDKELIKKEFKRIYDEQQGNPIIFQWIEILKDIILSVEGKVSTDKIITEHPALDINKEEYNEKSFIINVVHGPTIVDRKSVFQGHACNVNNENDVKDCMHYLLQNKKIAQATHNILAYRILLPNLVILQDCDDDGETHAASRVLHLLQILKLTNVMVVVSRWYGGIHLGPDRFKHINNAARQVLTEGNFINS
ncbi:hypothetical protein NQ317_004030 [Molorchus minor]|uniref:RWD domain-containing protein n=1 Tax=Molorchus minor TaxID=1323400 RepID=A0ABQ9JUL6_9CUCU|nr:hypothetical protein NQ317_004030 [Molorchus minor]